MPKKNVLFIFEKIERFSEIELSLIRSEKSDLDWRAVCQKQFIDATSVFNGKITMALVQEPFDEQI